MRPHLSLVTVLAFVLAAISLAVTAVRIFPAKSDSHRVVHAQLPPRLASYLGVYEPGEQRYTPIADFASAIGRQPNLVETFSGWPDPFDAPFAEALHQRGITPLIQIDPTDASIAGIGDGDYDDYLQQYADAVADFGHPVVIGFGHEMNASWYSWGYGHVPPATFVAAWRHVVDVFREEGADNVTWLWTIQASGPKIGSAEQWWPGAGYVTWVGIDNFYYRPTDTFATVFGRTIDEVKQFTKKPVLLSETAVGPFTDQTGKILDLFRGMTDYGALGLVWFDAEQHGGVFHQDWRLENSTLAETTFGFCVRNDLSLPAST